MAVLPTPVDRGRGLRRVAVRELNRIHFVEEFERLERRTAARLSFARV